MSELLPCPFCGGEAELTGFKAPEFWVWCPSCKASTDAHTCKGGAIAAWNTRAQTVFGMTLDEVRQMMKRDAERERTCHAIDKGDCLDGSDCPAWECSECGAVQPDDFTAYYCPNCGAKVIGHERNVQ